MHAIPEKSDLKNHSRCQKKQPAKNSQRRKVTFEGSLTKKTLKLIKYLQEKQNKTKKT